MIRIIIVDDHEIVVDGIKAMLSKEEEISVVGTADNGKRVIPLLKEKEVDVAVLDISMPEMDGMELTKYIKQNYQQIKILILSMHNNSSHIRRVIELGADGYILKNKGKEELVNAIYAICNGEKYFKGEVSDNLITSMQSNYTNGPIKLTRKEKEVLKLVANGMSTKQIAKELFIANSTVEKHKRNLIDKTGVKGSSKGLMKFAFENGYN